MSIEIVYRCNHRFEARVKGNLYDGLVSVADLCPDCRPRHLVTTRDIYGRVIETNQMEGELNGWQYTRSKPQQ